MTHKFPVAAGVHYEGGVQTRGICGQIQNFVSVPGVGHARNRDDASCSVCTMIAPVGLIRIESHSRSKVKFILNEAFI